MSRSAGAWLSVRWNTRYKSSPLYCSWAWDLLLAEEGGSSECLWFLLTVVSAFFLFLCFRVYPTLAFCLLKRTSSLNTQRPDKILNSSPDDTVITWKGGFDLLSEQVTWTLTYVEVRTVYASLDPLHLTDCQRTSSISGHSKNKNFVLENAIPVLGMKLKRE